VARKTSGVTQQEGAYDNIEIQQFMISCHLSQTL
jgi:hypothetical protein